MMMVLHPCGDGLIVRERDDAFAMMMMATPMKEIATLKVAI